MIFRVLLILIIVFHVYSQSGDKSIFFKGSWEELRQKASKDTMPFFVDFYADWCKPCVIMEKTFQTDTIKNYIKGKYLAYKVDVETKQGKKLARKYRAMGLPMIAFFDNRGKLMGRYIGYLYADEFIVLGDKYLEKFHKRLRKQARRKKKKRRKSNPN